MRRFLMALFGIVLTIGTASLLIGTSAGALTIKTAQDCDSNAVIRCGISNSSQLKQDAKPAGIACLYKHFGISSLDINSFDNSAVSGKVTRSGNVLVNGRVVATNAVTAGRQNMAGSMRFVCDNHSFFIRSPSVSFASSRLAAFVVMRNGRFAFAIISSCGNPVKATPVKPAVTKTKVTTQAQTQTQTVVVNNIPPQVKSTKTSRPAPATLPNTGPGDVIGVSGLATAFGAIGHYVYSRRRRD